MNQSRTHLAALLGVLLLSIALSSCALTPYSYEPLDSFGIEQRAVSKVQGPFQVRAAVVGDEEARQLFGIDLTRRGIQAVWLEIRNDSGKRARIAPYSLDKEYFPPHEVAYMYRKDFSKQGWLDMEQRFYEMSMQRTIPAGETASGIVFTNADPGTKTFNVDVYYLDQVAIYEHFTFYITAPGFTPDYAEIDFAGLYRPDEVQDVDLDGFRALLQDFPCCTTDESGARKGRPINVLIVAPGRELLQALLRASWRESSYERDYNYLKDIDYLFGRPPDSLFRKFLGRGRERNVIGVWLAPIRVEGVPVWMVQVKHALGRTFEIGEQILGVRLDPNVDDGRNYLLQDFWYAQSLKSFAWSRSGHDVSADDPEFDFNGNPFFSDGFRLVLWLTGDTVSLRDARDLKWDRIRSN